MKNQTAKFTCATDATLTISVRRGKTDWVISFRQQTPGEKTKLGKEYMELSREADAQQLFDKRVKEALAAGWVLAERATRASTAFTGIPAPPVAAMASTAARGAAAGRR